MESELNAFASLRLLAKVGFETIIVDSLLIKHEKLYLKGIKKLPIFKI